jgi:hypothetical protein
MATVVDVHTSSIPVDPRSGSSFFSRISWSAVLSGVVIAFLVNTLLNLIGLGIGLATIEPASGDTPGPATISTAAGIWWTVSGLIALFFGGWVAARLGGELRGGDGAWHGLVTWAAMGVLSLFVLTTALGPTVGGALGALGQAVPETAQMLDRSDASAGGARGQAREAAFEAAEAARSPEAREAAERTAKTGAKAALWAAVAMVLGALAASFGGRAGARLERDLDRASTAARS